MPSGISPTPGRSSHSSTRFDSADFEQDALKLFPVLLPNEIEPASIVRFLDRANGRIERAIRAKKKLIALLNEQKQAIIHRAVTRGLDAGVKLKPAGVAWLGDVPGHWRLVPNRSFLRLRREIVGELSKNYTLLSRTRRGIIARDLINPQGKFPASFATYQVVEAGDLVFCLFDSDETPRTVGLSAMHGRITGAYTVFRCPDQKLAQWAHLFYLSMDKDKLLKPAYTGLRKVIPTSAFLGLKTPIPPESERIHMLSVVERSTSEITQVVHRSEREIALLREYVARLTADVVTGKLDVRDAAKHLPADTVEPLGDDPAVDDEEVTQPEAE